MALPIMTFHAHSTMVTDKVKMVVNPLSGGSMQKESNPKDCGFDTSVNNAKPLPYLESDI